MVAQLPMKRRSEFAAVCRYSRTFHSFFEKAQAAVVQSLDRTDPCSLYFSVPWSSTISNTQEVPPFPTHRLTRLLHVAIIQFGHHLFEMTFSTRSDHSIFWWNPALHLLLSSYLLLCLPFPRGPCGLFFRSDGGRQVEPFTLALPRRY